MSLEALMEALIPDLANIVSGYVVRSCLWHNEKRQTMSLGGYYCRRCDAFFN